MVNSFKINNHKWNIEVKPEIDLLEEQAKKEKYKNYSQDGLIDEILELENINDKLSSALESAEDRIDKAIEYMQNYIELEEYKYNENVMKEFDEVIKILEGKG